MLVYIRYGTRLSGKVDSFAGSYVATKFFHIWYVPLIPLSSWLVLGNDSGIAIPMDWRSVLAGYARGIGSIAAFMFAFSLLRFFTYSAAYEGSLPAEIVVSQLLLPIAVVGTVVAAWAVLGRLSREAKARRVVYWDSIGYFVDPARLADQRHQFIENLRKDVQSRAQSLATGGYRDAYDPNAEWRKAACRPSTKDVEFLKRALTLARLEWSFASGAHKRDLGREHDLIWDNIKRLDPKVLKADAYNLKG
jgi:hypothetical protein